MLTLNSKLDICDMKQCFGGEVLQLSSESPTLRRKLLEVAQISLEVENHSQRIRNEIQSTGRASQFSPVGVKLDLVGTAMTEVLDITKDVFANLSDVWLHSNIATRTAALELFSSDLLTQSLAARIFWAFVRLCELEI